MRDSKMIMLALPFNLEILRKTIVQRMRCTNEINVCVICYLCIFEIGKPKKISCVELLIALEFV